MKVIISQIELDSAAQTLGFGAAHAFEQFGAADGNGNRAFEFHVLARIMHSYALRPGQKPMDKAQALTAMMPNAPSPFGAVRRRTPEEIAELKKICGACDFNVKGNCTKAKCCGGKLPLETMWSLNTTHCPMPEPKF